MKSYNKCADVYNALGCTFKTPAHLDELRAQERPDYLRLCTANCNFHYAQCRPLLRTWKEDIGTFRTLVVFGKMARHSNDSHFRVESFSQTKTSVQMSQMSFRMRRPDAQCRPRGGDWACTFAHLRHNINDIFNFIVLSSFI